MCDKYNTLWDDCKCMHSTITHFLDGMWQTWCVVRRIWINDHLLSIWYMTSIYLWDCCDSIHSRIAYSLDNMRRTCEYWDQQIDDHLLSRWEMCAASENSVMGTEVNRSRTTRVHHVKEGLWDTVRASFDWHSLPWRGKIDAFCEASLIARAR